MSLEETLAILRKDFAFKERDIQIIKALNETPLTVEELLNNVNIPKGRVYSYLKNLVKNGLVEKKLTSPTTYSSANLKHNVENFVRLKEKDFKESGEKLLSSLKEFERVEIVNDLDRYREIHLQFRESSKFYYTFLSSESLPLIFLPVDSQEESVKLLKGYFTYAYQSTKAKEADRSHFWKTLKKGKKDLKLLVSERIVENFYKRISEVFGNNYANKRMKEIAEACKKHDYKVGITPTKFPNQLHITDKALLFGVLQDVRGGKTIIAFVISNKRIVKRYAEIFNEVFNDSKTFEEFAREKGFL